jgi:protein-disulfide isomerase
MVEARDLRLRGTPSFVVNGRVLPGPPRYEQLARIIEEELEGLN